MACCARRRTRRVAFVARISGHAPGSRDKAFHSPLELAPGQQDAARKEQLARSLQQTIGGGDDSAYIEALKTKYKAEVLRADLKFDKSAPPAGK